ncbi:MAG: phosphomethylpyrimidine synthase ThiC [Clostridia bacterium]
MSITERMKNSEILAPVLERETITEKELLEGLETGSIVIPANPRHKNLKPVAIGKGLTTKVSASIGMYCKNDTPEGEIEKLRAAVNAGTDALMDLSVRGDIKGFRKQVIEAATVPVGTLPLYEALSYAEAKRGSALKMEADDLFEIIEEQAKDGVDFMAFHPAITLKMIEHIKESGRIDPMVSFGGSHLMGWMIHNQKENPLLEQYDRLLEICKKYDVTLALADANRPGCIADSLDGPMVEELVLLGDLVQRAQKAGVQIMVKGPGHMPINHVEATMTLEKSLCKGAPYFVFGPLLTDIAVGYDHINAAIGGALSAYYGADFLCYVTAAEHLGLPNKEQVHEGVIAARIGAHSGDIAKGIPGAARWDLEMSLARKDLDWDKQMELAIDPPRAKEIRETRNPSGSKGCAMCGKYCAMKILSKFLSLDHVYEC